MDKKVRLEILIKILQTVYDISESILIIKKDFNSDALHSLYLELESLACSVDIVIKDELHGPN